MGDLTTTTTNYYQGFYKVQELIFTNLSDAIKTIARKRFHLIKPLDSMTHRQNQNSPDINVPEHSATKQKTGWGISLPVPWTKTKHSHFLTD